MPYRKHNRYISNEQFSDGTTIDGSRIDGALQDVQDLVNWIPRGDLKDRYTQTQYVMGWSPSKDPRGANQSDTSLPWMQAVNDLAQLATVTGGVASPPDPFQNPQRAKGYSTEGISPLSPESTSGLINGAQYIWTVPIHFGKSVIIQSFKVFFMLDNAAVALNPYNNTYAFTTPPEGLATGFTTDVTIQMIVDRPKAYGSEDRRLNQILANKTNFAVPDANMNAVAAAPTVDMFPTPWPGGNMAGKYFEVTINEPLPEDTRLRLAIIIPRYTAYAGPPATIASTWGAFPWLKQYYSATLTVLEELER